MSHKAKKRLSSIEVRKCSLILFLKSVVINKVTTLGDEAQSYLKRSHIFCFTSQIFCCHFMKNGQALKQSPWKLLTTKHQFCWKSSGHYIVCFNAWCNFFASRKLGHCAWIYLIHFTVSYKNSVSQTSCTRLDMLDGKWHRFTSCSWLWTLRSFAYFFFAS